MDTQFLPTPQTLLRYDQAGPRYTSYPTADRFVEAFGEDDYRAALMRRSGTAFGKLTPLSLYVHIPFCESLCYYCACNKIITKHHERATTYLDYLAREVALHTAVLGKRQKVTQLHLGGGSPTFLNAQELERLMVLLRENFDIQAGAEMSIEVDPRTIAPSMLETLHALGFNRLSLGVQDYDPQVQQAVHRVQSPQLVQSLLDAARARGFESVNFDLIYGLPKQTLVSFERTIDQVIAQRPDRIAVYAYAHLPVRFKPQRRIHTEDLPASSDKLQMLITAQHKLLQAGYAYIGMDHFALPSDELAVAQRMGRLHRNFQGYSTQPDCDLLALGVSSIGRMGATYHQNAKTLEEYYDALDHDRLPVVRGLALSRDDLVRRAIIMALMCQGQVLFEEINQAYLVDFQRAFAREWEALAELEEDGLVSTDTQGIDVTPKGRFLVRAIAMVFDRYLQADLDRSRFSKII